MPAAVVDMFDAMARAQDDSMTRFLPKVLAVALLGLAAVVQPPLAAAQQLVFDAFPASVLVRGENVWLRLDPATDTEVLTLLQRGDPITVTGESVFDGEDEYYPVQSDLTGETGWIHALFIDPRSISGTSTVVVPLETVDVPADQSAPADEGNQAQQDREARRQARQANAAQEPEPDAEAAAADDRAARRAARQAEQDPAAAEAEQPANDRAARRAARQAEPGANADGANTATDNLTFSGTEATSTPEFTPPSDVLAVTANYDGNGNFVVTAISPDGTEQVLFDERGPFSGDTTFDADPAATLYLNVEANGAWEVIVAPAS
jgi:hypothetical protein